jgi:hypothetical protein
MANAGIFATGGSKIYIGGPLSPKPSDFVLADFATQSWLPISWVENIGQFGDSSAAVNFDAIDAKRTIKSKGSRNAGDMTLVCGIDYKDPGQIAIRAAEATSNSYAWRVQFNDQAVGGQPSFRYFVALVMEAREDLGTSNNVMKLNATLGINSNIVRVAATP